MNFFSVIVADWSILRSAARAYHIRRRLRKKGRRLCSGTCLGDRRACKGLDCPKFFENLLDRSLQKHGLHILSGKRAAGSQHTRVIDFYYLLHTSENSTYEDLTNSCLILLNKPVKRRLILRYVGAFVYTKRES